jgi:hypothetical protein
VDRLEKAVEKFLEKPKIRGKLTELPTKERMQKEFNSCLGDGNNAWIRIFNKVQASRE